MEHLGLAETIAALRGELAEAMTTAQADTAAGVPAGDIHFAVGQVQLEFSVGVTRDAAARGGVRFWVVELGTEGSYRREEIQRVVVMLEAPTDATGAPVQVTRDSRVKP